MGITKKQMLEMPLGVPFSGVADAPLHVQWDIFHAGLLETLHVDVLQEGWRIVDEDGVAEPEVDHTWMEDLPDAVRDEIGATQPQGGYDDVDAAMAALNDGFTLVRLPYGPNREWSRIVVAVPISETAPRLRRTVPPAWWAKTNLSRSE